MNIDIILNRRTEFPQGFSNKLKTKNRIIITRKKRENPVYICFMQQQQKMSEDQLDAIYKYLSISFDEMTDEEQKMWTLLLSIYDPEFDDIENDSEYDQ